MSNFTQEDSFTLDKLRSTLVRIEDTIIFALIERAQFSLNSRIYTSGALEFTGTAGQRSFLEYFFPDEYAFTSPLPDPILPAIEFKQYLIPNDINVNEKIMDIYIKNIVPCICESRDDNNYGSSATKDIDCLQALSRRIHYGKFIAESKFRSSPEEYIRLALANDREGIYELLTNKKVEEKLLQRLRQKAIVYGQTVDQEQEGQSTHLRVPVELVVELYERWVIPLTKEVEVDYLVERGRKASEASRKNE
ncbi:chorismate mutase [Spinellus fusiger]|nr:chorismate mutase [Spinellus fusiger]